MLKKILIISAILAAALAFSINIFSRKAPDLLKGAIENALNKKVIIQSIDYHFPGVFELGGFEIREKGRFEGETSFYVDHVRLDVSLLSLSTRTLVVDKMEVENANIIIRKYAGKLTHSLSDAIKKKTPVAAQGAEAVPAQAKPAVALPLEIRQFILKKSNFKFIDYDAQEDGFVIGVDEIDAVIKNIYMPFSNTKTSYKITSRLPQGRDQRAAEIGLSGWTVFKSMDTDANLTLSGIFLPYFRPYYAQVTPALIEDGYLDSRINLRIEKKELTLNVDLEIVGLLFRSYEVDNQLFGLKAEEILSFLKDRSGKLKFQFTARWNLADRSVRARDVIRQSIERSLKNIILDNIGNVIENTIRKVEDQGLEKTKEDIQGTIKKIKELFKY